MSKQININSNLNKFKFKINLLNLMYDIKKLEKYWSKSTRLSSRCLVATVTKSMSK